MKHQIAINIFGALLFLGSGCFAAQAQNLADVHKDKGVQCQQCHIQKDEVPTIDQCTVCHPTNALVEKTKPTNPSLPNAHFSPHYKDQLECTNCHHGHEASQDFCSSCHTFGFKVK